MFEKPWEKKRSFKGEPDVHSPGDQLDRVAGGWEAVRPYQVDLNEFTQQISDEYAQNGRIRDLENAPRGAAISRTVEAQSLKKLGELPIECTVTDYGKQLHALSGRRRSALPYYPEAEVVMRAPDIVASSVLRNAEADPVYKAQLDARQTDRNQVEYARFTIHNHPQGFDQHVISPGDFNMAGNSIGEIHFMVNEDGIIPFSYNKESEWYRSPGVFQQLALLVQSKDRVMRKQQEAGIAKFFVPWDGDEKQQQTLCMICDYINDPSKKWTDVEVEIRAQ